MATTPAGAAPTRDPKRVIGEHAIDLSPLFKWWNRREGPRPLAAWVHLTGTVVGTNAGAWILEAQIEGGHGDPDKPQASAKNSTTKILLQNPPLEELSEFRQLRGQLTQLETEKTRLADEQNRAAARERAVSAQQKAVPRTSTESRLLLAEDRQLKRTEGGTRTQLRNVEAQIQAIKARMSNFPGMVHYTVDCFALDLRQDNGSLPVYDRGRVLK